jgi:integrase/recombinase XerD
MAKHHIIPLSDHYRETARSFYEYLLQIGYSSRVCRSKWRSIKEFLHFAQEHVSTDLSRITSEDLLKYQEYLQHRRGKTDGQAARSVADRLIAIQNLYTMLQQKGEIELNPASTLKIHYPPPAKERAALTQGEVNELYSHCQTYKEKAILALCYGCGLRVSELVECNIEDVKLRDYILVVPRGKGNKRRTVPMSQAVVKDLTDYFFKVRLQEESSEAPSTSSGQAFILHSRGKRMQKESYNKLLKKLIARTQNKALEAKQLSLHHLRHSIATHLIEQGVPLESVRAFLGHSQLETTAVYTHISQLQLQKLAGG